MFDPCPNSGNLRPLLNDGYLETMIVLILKIMDGLFFSIFFFGKSSSQDSPFIKVGEYMERASAAEET